MMAMGAYVAFASHHPGYGATVAVVAAVCFALPVTFMLVMMEWLPRLDTAAAQDEQSAKCRIHRPADCQMTR